MGSLNIETESSRPTGVYDSGQAVALTLETMASRQAAMDDDRALSELFGVPELDEFINPWWPGDLCGIIGLPSNGKSFLARMIALRVVRMLINGGHTDRAVVWVTTEESVEAVTAAWLAAISGVSSTDLLSGKLSRVHSVGVNAAVSEVASWPLFVVGHTLGSHKDDSGRNVSRRLSTDEIEACFDYIASPEPRGLGKEIIFINIDYLQRVRKPIEIGNREEHIRLTIDWARDMANKFSTPLNMCTQSKFEVFKRPEPMPTIEDSEWSSNFGQSVDTLLSVWMPQTKPGIGEIVSFRKWQSLLVQRGMLFLYVAKQKMGVGQEAFLLKAEPHLMRWEMLEVEDHHLNEGRSSTNGGKAQSDYINSWQQQEVPFHE